jgi:alkanesulfonate monooxygenase SsuD/methylene tetrahydromethanopterin reductase-like flavin-dependent oxidoreductase (luciferase family)
MGMTGMKFSMIFEAQLADPTPEREAQLIHQCIEQAILAEEVGFDGVWAVEHHALKWYAHMSAPEIFLAAVAAKTSRIRIGHGVVCLPFNYNFPIRVAERAAMLDIISGGRMNLGAGRGGTAQEMSLCGVDLETAYEEVEESLRIIGSVWQEETFEWHGTLLTIESPPGQERHTVLPRPLQRPHPPLFMACTRPDTVCTAAEFGVGALIFGFGGLDSVRAQKALYDETRLKRTGARFVSTEVNDHLAALCPTIVLNDAAEARRIGVRGQRFFGESIMYWSAPGTPPPHQHTENDDNEAVMAERRRDLLAKFETGELPERQRSVIMAGANIEHAYGDAEVAIDYVRQLESIGVDEVMCLIQMGTVPQEVCLETIRQWGSSVIPCFR